MVGLTPDASRPDIRLARVYDVEAESVRGGYKVLVDRLWPRGIARADARWDEWCKDVAPSTALRRWYNHDELRFDEFARRYNAELRRAPASLAIDRLLELVGSNTVTLVTASRDVDHSSARVLQRRLASRRFRSRRRGAHPRGVTGELAS